MALASVQQTISIVMLAAMRLGHAHKTSALHKPPSKSCWEQSLQALPVMPRTARRTSVVERPHLTVVMDTVDAMVLPLPSKPSMQAPRAPSARRQGVAQTMQPTMHCAAKTWEHVTKRFVLHKAPTNS
jgi:hypothetical protein